MRIARRSRVRRSGKLRGDFERCLSVRTRSHDPFVCSADPSRLTELPSRCALRCSSPSGRPSGSPDYLRASHSGIRPWRPGGLMRYHALIAAAGAGSRFGADIPKQYALLDGKPVLAACDRAPRRGIPVAQDLRGAGGRRSLVRSAIGADERVVALRCGGATRAETVRNALAAIPDAANDDWIVVHDAARPCVDRGVAGATAARARRRSGRRHPRDPRGGGVEARRRRGPHRPQRAARRTVAGADAADVPVRRAARGVGAARRGARGRRSASGRGAAA